jgi:hypothetical protein
MLARARFVFLTIFWLAASGAAMAQTNCLGISSTIPCIDKIDPPNWWANLPSPMLLVHGNHLADTHVAVAGSNISVTRTQASANGHYLFIGLDTKNAAPQKISLRVTNSAGSTTAPFVLNARKPASAGFQRFSSRDVMYLIMTDRFADGDPSNDPNPGQRALPRGWHGGDLRGIEQHLDYLKQLGVTTIWTTPRLQQCRRPRGLSRLLQLAPEQTLSADRSPESPHYPPLPQRSTRYAPVLRLVSPTPQE